MLTFLLPFTQLVTWIYKTFPSSRNRLGIC
uniref:Uncharacterized protein n=1 Tax=Rhizophora mucronata TaxID=61149 RepID=A0A2P2Q2M9_RHIMU